MIGVFGEAVAVLVAEVNYIATRGELLIGMGICIAVSVFVWLDLR